MRPVLACLLLSAWANSSSAGVRDVPLDELVRESAAIVAGRVVKEDRVEIAPGVIEKTLSIEVRDILKGRPSTTVVARDGGTARVVRIRSLDGPYVPSGKRTFGLRDEGLWFLSTIGSGPKGVYHAAMRHDEARAAEVRGMLGALPRYEMQLIWMAGTEPPEFLFVVGKVGFRSLDAFRDFLGRLPRGSTLEWDPGCKRMGGEPLLSSEEEMEAFRAFCEEKGVNLVLVPGG